MKAAVARGDSLSTVERTVLKSVGGMKAAKAEKVVRMMQTTRSIAAQERRARRAVLEAYKAMADTDGGRG